MITLCYLGVGIAIALAFIRFVLGPTLPDRSVAFDVITSGIMIGLIVFGIAEDFNFLFDVLLVISFLSFLGATASAYFLEKTRDLRGINEIEENDKDENGVAERGVQR